MKRTVLTIILIMLAISPAFSNSDKFLTTEASLGTGISIYDSSNDDLRKDLLSGKDYKRIIANVTLNTNLNISDPLKIMFGAEMFFDFLWNSPDYYNTVDYSLFTGIKLFPNKTGLNFSISYVLGSRTDFFSESPKQDSKAWGNGFRLAIQYDFMEDKDYKIKPNVGAYYRCVPRGNYYKDHILCLYGGIRF